MMEIALLNLLCYFFSVAMCYLSGKTTQPVHAMVMEFPNYRVVRSESDFEIRLYNESSWMSASVRGTSFNISTQTGFHRLYQYIHGANLNSSKLAFTAPILTSIVSSLSSSRGNIDYTVRFYVSTKYQGKPPQPNPELKLHLDKWNSHCEAVRKFSGFASDDNIDTEVEALASSMNKHLTANSAAIQYRGSYNIAQYNASHELSGRLNEVWISVSAPSVVDCPPSL